MLASCSFVYRPSYKRLRDAASWLNTASSTALPLACSFLLLLEAVAHRVFCLLRKLVIDLRPVGHASDLFVNLAVHFLHLRLRIFQVPVFAPIAPGIRQRHFQAAAVGAGFPAPTIGGLAQHCGICARRNGSFRSPG